jgi:thioredoxin reductase (NADPH)
MEKVVIIGSGPAGLTAALYTARANLNPVVIAGPQFGGQVSWTHEIENYPGFPGGSGAELIETMRGQVEKFGARIDYDIVLSVDLSKGSPFTVRTGNTEYVTESLIITSGATPRKLGIPGEEELTGKGTSYCATCDGFFFRGKKVVVIGGGDSAVKESIFLTKFATSVDIIHRRDTLRAEHHLQERARKEPKINFIWDTVVDKINGGAKVESITLRNIKTGGITEHATDGVFIFVGHEPSNALFVGQVDMDEHGYIKTNKLMMTSIDGVFAAGEIQDPIYKQVATSVGQGCAAAMSAEQWLSEREKKDDTAISPVVIAEKVAEHAQETYGQNINQA